MRLGDFLLKLSYGSELAIVNAEDVEDVLYEGLKPLIWSDSFGSCDIFKICLTNGILKVYIFKGKELTA